MTIVAMERRLLTSHRARRQFSTATSDATTKASELLKNYTHGHAPAVVASHARRTATEYAPDALKVMRVGDSVLDVGCGPGTITKGFKKVVRGGPSDRAERNRDVGHVIGIDLDEGVLREARKNVEPEHVEFLKASGYEIPFPDDAFDVVHAHQVLQHVKDPRAMIAEMLRVTKRDGGHLICRDVDYSTWSWFPDLPELREFLSMYRQVCLKNETQPDAGRYYREWFNTHPAKRLVHPKDQQEIVVRPVVYADPERIKIWGETWAKRITETKLGDQALKYGIVKSRGSFVHIVFLLCLFERQRLICSNNRRRVGQNGECV